MDRDDFGVPVTPGNMILYEGRIQTVTLTIELDTVEEKRLFEAAASEGLAPAELAKRVLAANLHRSHDLYRANGQDVTAIAHDREIVARVQRIRGKFAYSGAPLASEELQQERQVDKNQREQLIDGPRS